MASQCLINLLLESSGRRTASSHFHKPIQMGFDQVTGIVLVVRSSTSISTSIRPSRGVVAGLLVCGALPQESTHQSASLIMTVSTQQYDLYNRLVIVTSCLAGRALVCAATPHLLLLLLLLHWASAVSHS